MVTTASEREIFRDETTGLRVTRLTDHPSNHPYFTNPGWFDGGCQLVIASDRHGPHDLVAVDLATGEQRQITRFADPAGIEPFSFCVDAVGSAAFGWVRNAVERIDLATGAREILFQLEPGWSGTMANVTADGAAVCFGAYRNNGIIGFEAIFNLHPLSRIFRLDLASGALRVIHEREAWMGHVNTAPGHPERLSFCHEGPWTQVEHRVWCADMERDRVWKVCETAGPPACVGHEYWLADGRRIAYHGFDTVPQPVLGICDVESGARREFPQPVKTKHTHSLDGELIIGDGSPAFPWILAWRLTPEGLRGPWKVCRHGGGWSEQRRHVHPRIAPDGRSVVFTSDAGGFPRVYAVELPDDIESLPAALPHEAA